MAKSFSKRSSLKKRPDPYSDQGETSLEGEFADGRSQDPPKRKYPKPSKPKPFTPEAKKAYGDAWDS
jgi:hypothetical protein